MLSILIPTKDYDCHLLVEELQRQGEALGCPYEILLGEDGTRPENLRLNMSAELLDNCRRIIMEKNIGRANIRNALALEAKYRDILFIDCDAIVEKPDFLECYIKALQENEVVCGGLYHAEKQPDTECSLRFRYEKEADKQRDAATRNKAPYERFTTFNFAIRRELFMSILFNPNIVRYGHEDTLFGKELERGGHSILHIDNRLLHNGLESSPIYLAKVELSILTLNEIKDSIGSTPLINAAEKLQKWHMHGIFMFFWRIFKGTIRKNLLSKAPSLAMLKIYKLGFYLSQNR